jgi:hypothetical protein
MRIESHGLDCELDIEPPDKSVGYNGRAFLVTARIGGVDIVTLLADSVIFDIEIKALQDFNEC